MYGRGADVIVTYFEEEGATRFSKIVTVGTSKISVVVDVCENLKSSRRKPTQNSSSLTSRFSLWSEATVK